MLVFPFSTDDVVVDGLLLGLSFDDSVVGCESSLFQISNFKLSCVELASSFDSVELLL